MPRVLFIFLDGVGIGKNDASINPFFATDMPSLRRLLNGNMMHLRHKRMTSQYMSVVPLNATLGVSGLPQSGTGQTALLTGVNAPRFIGKHFGPYPYSTLKPILKEKNIFLHLSQIGKKVHYANAFPPKYFEYINSPKNRMTAITMSWQVSGFKLNESDSINAGGGLSSDITNERWNALGFPHVRQITPHEAGKRLYRMTSQYDFVFYEYYATDQAGHSQSMTHAEDVLTKLDGLLEGILHEFDYENTLLMMTSDHGNLEDLSTKTHTRNPVPLLCVGKGHSVITSKAKNLAHVAPAIISLLS